MKYKNKSYTLNEILKKSKIKIWNKVVQKTQNYKFYPYLYLSTWHAVLNPAKYKNSDPICYYTAIPNPGAGIGHQLANWIAGYWYSKQLGVPFAHTEFSNEKWAKFLGFREQLPLVTDLIKNHQYKKRKLPIFKYDSVDGLILTKKISASYAQKKIILVAEQDQAYMEQYGVINELKHLFNNASERVNDILQYDPSYFNIAVHVRRTVIIDSVIIEEDEQNKKKRWLADNYYLNILKTVLSHGKFQKKPRVYIFSTAELPEFKNFSNDIEIIFCHDWDEYSSFLHLIRADLLITSKSSFSYKAALISEGYKISPQHFWHGYPVDRKWIMADNNGKFELSKLEFS